MTISEQHLLKILEIISQNDGAYGWCQIDRELVRRGIAGIHVGQALNVLLSKGLVTASGDPNQASGRYSITEQGLAVLKEQKGMGTRISVRRPLRNRWPDPSFDHY